MHAAIKRALASRLCPDVFLDAERWQYAQRHLDDLDKWCSFDLPAVGKAARWVLDSVGRHFMPLSRYHSLTLAERMALPEPIDAFRRELRRDAGLDEVRGRREIQQPSHPEDAGLRKIAAAIRDGRPGVSVRLTRLVDGDATYTAEVHGLPPHEFDDRDNAMEWASDAAALVQARTVAAAFVQEATSRG